MSMSAADRMFTYQGPSTEFNAGSSKMQAEIWNFAILIGTCVKSRT